MKFNFYLLRGYVDGYGEVVVEWVVVVEMVFLLLLLVGFTPVVIIGSSDEGHIDHEI